MTTLSSGVSYLFDKIFTPYESCSETFGFLLILLSLKINKKSAHGIMLKKIFFFTLSKTKVLHNN